MSRSEEHKLFVTLGASNHGSAGREEHDYYATDPVALELLLEKESFQHNVWECACGEGHLSRVLEEHGYDVLSSDLVDRGYGIWPVDFLQATQIFDGDIITNPPYKYAREFVEHALELVKDGSRVAMFLKIQFLEGKSRRELFDKAPPEADLCGVRPHQLLQERGFQQGAARQQQRAGVRLVYLGKGIYRRTDSALVQLTT